MKYLKPVELVKNPKGEYVAFLFFWFKMSYDNRTFKITFHWNLAHK